MSLFDAIAAGDGEAVRNELDRHPARAGERNEDGLSPVLYALANGQAALVETILDANPALDVFDAAAVGRTRGLEELIDAEPALVHARAADGTTPLHLAARFDQRGAAELLLEYGADAAARDGDDRTPADVAAGDTRELFGADR
jgi:ankyrin repeat protein